MTRPNLSVTIKVYRIEETMTLRTDENDPNKVWIDFKVGAEQVGKEDPNREGKWFGYADLYGDGKILYMFCDGDEQFFDTKEDAENYAIEQATAMLSKSITQMMLHFGEDNDAP